MRCPLPAPAWLDPGHLLRHRRHPHPAGLRRRGHRYRLCAGHTVEHFTQLDSGTLADYLATLAAFVDHLDTAYPLFLIDEDGYLIDEHTSPYSWNDDPTRTADEVVTALEDAADEWNHLHTDGDENR